VLLLSLTDVLVTSSSQFLATGLERIVGFSTFSAGHSADRGKFAQTTLMKGEQ
jgi:hypothetical protein